MSEGLLRVDDDDVIRFVNAPLCAMLGYAEEELLGRKASAVLLRAESREAVASRWRDCVKGAGEALELALSTRSGAPLWVSLSATPLADAGLTGSLIVFTDLSARRFEEALSSAQTQLFEKIAEGAALDVCLTDLAHMVESRTPGAACAIMLLDREGVHLRHGAAPSLPEEYVRAIDGAAIGPTAGSCGTAAFRAETVIVEDIAIDPLWQHYRELALPHGLRACWSTPIFNAARSVLGTFAVYYRQPGRPSDSDSRVIGIASHLAAIAICRDRAVATLQESETNYRTLFEVATDGIFVASAQGRWEAVNAEGCRMLGYTREEMLTLSIPDIVVAGEQSRVPTEAARLRNDEVTHSQWVYRRKDGSEFVGEVAATRLPDGRLLGILRDLTGQRRAEAAIRESEERLRLTLDATHTGIFDWDVPGNRITWSSWHEVLWGMEPGTFPGTYEAFASRVHAEDLPGINEEIARCIASGDRWAREFRVVWPDGSEHWIAGRGEFTFADDGRPLRMLGSVVEVTERKQAEEALRVANEQLVALSHRLLEIQENERRQLARELHDELGQVLTATKLRLHSLQREECIPPARMAEGMELVDRAIAQVRSLSLELRPPLLDDFGLPAALRWLTGRQRDTGLRIELTGMEEEHRFDPAVEIACFRVSQEALNNILKHAQARSAGIELRLRESALHLHVRDDGKGFDVAAARRSASQGGSLGLLSMEERAALADGGVEWISAPGRGTEVHAWFKVST